MLIMKAAALREAARGAVVIVPVRQAPSPKKQRPTLAGVGTSEIAIASRNGKRTRATNASLYGHQRKMRKEHTVNRHPHPSGDPDQHARSGCQSASQRT